MSWWKCCCTHTGRVAICVILIFVAVVFDIIGFAVPYWYYEESGGTQSFGGLWKACTKAGGVTSCTDLDNNLEAWFKTVQATEIIGLLLLVAAVILILVVLICCQNNFGVKLSAMILLLSAATFILIGVIVYGARSSASITDNLHFAFGFVIAAAGLAILGAICMCYGIKEKWTVEDMDDSC